MYPHPNIFICSLIGGGCSGGFWCVAQCWEPMQFKFGYYQNSLICTTSPHESSSATHAGICPDCAERFLDSWPVTLNHYLHDIKTFIWHKNIRWKYFSSLRMGFLLCKKFSHRLIFHLFSLILFFWVVFFHYIGLFFVLACVNRLAESFYLTQLYKPSHKTCTFSQVLFLSTILRYLYVIEE